MALFAGLLVLSGAAGTAAAGALSRVYINVYINVHPRGTRTRKQMRIAILGAPGSGKGMQAKLLAAEHGIAHITANDMLRAAHSRGKLGRAQRTALAAGHIDDALLMQLLEDRLRARDAKRGFIIDGFPRNIPQAQALDALLGTHARALQLTLHIHADASTLTQRLAGRLICQTCGATYNRVSAPPQKRGKCDDCEGKLAAETGGGARTAPARIEAYLEETAPLIAYYKAQHKLRTVMADAGADDTRAKIAEIVDLEIRPLQMKSLETAAERETFDEEIHTVIAGGEIQRVESGEETVDDDSAAKKSPARNFAAQKSVVQKSAPRNSVAQDSAPRKVSVSKPAARKTTAKKSAPQKTVARNSAPQKVSVSKPAATKPTAKKLTAQKSTPRKTSPKVSPQQNRARKTPAQK